MLLSLQPPPGIGYYTTVLSALAALSSDLYHLCKGSDINAG